MTIRGRLAGWLGALALLGSGAFPAAVTACAGQGAKASCCCSGSGPSGAMGHRCCCPQPEKPAPGGPCRELKASPDASSPAFAPVLELPGAGILAPVSFASIEDAPLRMAFLFLRTEPGWDPGNLLPSTPLRL